MTTSLTNPTAEHAPAAARLLRPQECALAVVDIQEKLLPAIVNKDALLRNASLLARLATLLGLPVMLTTQYSKGLGPTVAAIVELLPQARQIDKLEFGCFGNSGFCQAAKQLPGQRTTLLVCGMEAHICVLQTVLGALNEGYAVHVASDAVGSRTEANWRVGLERMRDAGAVISSAEMMIYELLGNSGSAEFKQMLQHLK